MTTGSAATTRTCWSVHDHRGTRALGVTLAAAPRGSGAERCLVDSVMPPQRPASPGSHPLVDVTVAGLLAVADGCGVLLAGHPDSGWSLLWDLADDRTRLGQSLRQTIREMAVARRDAAERETVLDITVGGRDLRSLVGVARSLAAITAHRRGDHRPDGPAAVLGFAQERALEALL